MWSRKERKMSLNLVAISGNVTRDAELRGTGGGRSKLEVVVDEI